MRLVQLTRSVNDVDIHVFPGYICSCWLKLNINLECKMQCTFNNWLLLKTNNIKMIHTSMPFLSNHLPIKWMYKQSAIVNIWTIYIALQYFKLISHLNSDPSLPFKFHKIHCGSHIVFATHLVTSGKQGQGSGKSVTIQQSTLNKLDERIHHCRQRTFWIPRKGILTSWTLRKESNFQPSNTKGHLTISCSPYFDKHFE